MSLDRKGFLTPEGEVMLEQKLKFKNRILEATDLLLLRTVDNVILAKAVEKIPDEWKEMLFEGIDLAIQEMPEIEI